MTWVQPMLATNCSVGASTRKRQAMWPGRPQVQVQQTSRCRNRTAEATNCWGPSLKPATMSERSKAMDCANILSSASPNPGFALWMGNWYVLFVDASMHMYELNTPKHTKRNDWESKDRMTYCMSSFRRKHLMRQVPKAWPPSLRNIKAKKD